ncbi:ABC transporter permease, partial [Candidatus Micrarchaeota archaeon]|nr:ABC transporter permease [Candidatus Micrarchaeota archaeon]
MSRRISWADIFSYSFKYLRTQSLRSWLTISGIVIGVSLIVVLLSIGIGLEKDVKSQMAAFGSDMIVVYPMDISQMNFMSLGPSKGKLFEKDAELMKQVPGVEVVTRFIMTSGSIAYKDQEITSPLYGVDANIFEVYPDYIELEKGRFFKDGESRVVILAYTAANDLFRNEKLEVNKFLIINGEKYRIVGTLKEIGTSLSASDDSAIYITINDARKIAGNELAPKELSALMADLYDDYPTEEAEERIIEKLASSHGVSVEDKDFITITADAMNEIVGTVLGMITTFLFTISVISGIVGGVGMANTMFMSVLERTKEIGILKSIGAKAGEIRMLFLVEGAIISFVGGIIGCLTALILIYIASFWLFVSYDLWI